MVVTHPLVQILAVSVVDAGLDGHTESGRDLLWCSRLLATPLALSRTNAPHRFVHGLFACLRPTLTTGNALVLSDYELLLEGILGDTDKNLRLWCFTCLGSARLSSAEFAISVSVFSFAEKAILLGARELVTTPAVRRLRRV